MDPPPSSSSCRYSNSKEEETTQHNINSHSPIRPIDRHAAGTRWGGGSGHLYSNHPAIQSVGVAAHKVYNFVFKLFYNFKLKSNFFKRNLPKCFVWNENFAQVRWPVPGKTLLLGWSRPAPFTASRQALWLSDGRADSRDSTFCYIDRGSFKSTLQIWFPGFIM